MAKLEREEIQNPTETTSTPKLNDIESKIAAAMLSRINLFREKSDSLTFEGVRRLLEKELGMEEFSLDVHKRFVKDLLIQCLNHSADNASKKSGEPREREITVKKEARESLEEVEYKTESQERGSEDEKRMEDSPVMGLLTGQGKTKQEPEESQIKENKTPDESTIKKALWKRSSYIKANLEKVTMAGLRRLLEEDLELEKHALDPYKKFVSAQLDEILESTTVAETKKNVKKFSDGKLFTKKGSNKRIIDASDKENDEVEEDEDKEKQQKKPRQMLDKSELSKKRKRPEKETKESGKKRTKPAEKVADDSSDAEDGENSSEDVHYKSTVKIPAKKKEASTPVYGKRVENLKSIMKSCAMSVPPSIYKKVKQVPENKREAQLIKELEEILSREGLSSNPSEKEIKEVRKRKERAKELEGIDMSNIVSSSRRRSTTSYAPPPKQKMPVESDEGADDGEDDDDDDDDNNNDDDDDEADEIVDDDDGDDDQDHESENEDADEERDEESE